jgi:hypothetical protein
MAKKLINRTGTADVSFDDGTGAILLADQVNSFDVGSATEFQRTDVFSNEGEIDQEPGGEQIAVSVTGFLAYDDPDVFVPIPAVHNKAWVFTFHTGCTLTGNFDMPGARMGRPTNGIAFFSVQLLSKPGFVVVWDTAGT